MAHQGVVAVNGNRFTGNGTFYFALVGNGGAGNNLWTNDGTELGTTNRPSAGVTIAVADGIYSANLGGGTMTPIQPSVFNNANVVLRIWFKDAVDPNPGNGVQQLMPDQRIATVPYAARSAFEPPIGSIIAWHKNADGVPPQLPDGWVECNGQFATDDPSTPVDDRDVPNLNGEARFLRGGANSGVQQPASTVFKDPFIDCGHFLFPFDAGGDFDIVETVPWGGTVPQFGPGASSGNCAIGSFDRGRVRPVNMSVVWIMRVK